MSCRLKSAVDKAARLEKENGNLKAKMDASNKALETMTAENESIKTKLHKVEQRHKAVSIFDRSARIFSIFLYNFGRPYLIFGPSCVVYRVS